MNWILTGALVMLVGVVFGAFGAHGLKGKIEPTLLQAFETGVLYQFHHGMAILIGGCLLRWFPSGFFNTAEWLWLIGILLFSGSLYALALSGIRALGIITPIGGLLFIAGWISFALGSWKNLPKIQ